jgi:hypothetical protein
MLIDSCPVTIIAPMSSIKAHCISLGQSLRASIHSIHYPTRRSTNTQNLSTRLWDVFSKTWYLGFTSFGGPAVHFQIFYKHFVAGHKWLDEQTACILLPAKYFFKPKLNEIKTVSRVIRPMSEPSRSRIYKDGFLYRLQSWRFLSRIIIFRRLESSRRNRHDTSSPRRYSRFNNPTIRCLFTIVRPQRWYSRNHSCCCHAT